MTKGCEQKLVAVICRGIPKRVEKSEERNAAYSQADNVWNGEERNGNYPIRSVLFSKKFNTSPLKTLRGPFVTLVSLFCCCCCFFFQFHESVVSEPESENKNNNNRIELELETLAHLSIRINSLLLLKSEQNEKLCICLCNNNF